MNAKQAREITDKAVDGMGLQQYLDELASYVQKAAQEGRGTCGAVYRGPDRPNKEILNRLYKHFKDQGFCVDLKFSTAVDIDPPYESWIILSW